MTRAVEIARSYLAALGNEEPDDVARHVADSFVNEHQSEIGTGCAGREQIPAAVVRIHGSVPEPPLHGRRRGWRDG